MTMSRSVLVSIAFSLNVERQACTQRASSWSAGGAMPLVGHEVMPNDVKMAIAMPH